MAQFTNQAQLSYNGNVTSSNIAVGEILNVLTVTKTIVSDEYSPNDTITNVITIVNSGDTTLSGLTVTDNLGEYSFNSTTLVPMTYTDDTVQYFVNGALQPTPSVTGTPSLTISNISVPANGNATIIYETVANKFAPLGANGSIVNSATVSGSGITPVTASDTITARQTPYLTIAKTVSPVPVTENGRLTYTFLIQNTGSLAATANDAAVVTDTFNPILTDLSVQFNNAAWTANTNYTYNDADGSFATVSGQIIVPAATFTQDAVTGEWITTPGTSTLIVSGTV